ncbi:MAG: nuclear transport factor 2 family protein [Sedimentisphaerales bacterium]|nr:nuclear transport factor 2 family protein [Sedimentisphaerales bacterium]
MKKVFSTILILTLVSVLFAARSNPGDISPAQQKTIKNEILKVHDEMKKAGESLNADELFKYVLDVNDVIIENGVLRATRKTALDITKDGFQGIKELTYTYNHKNINVISPTAALWTGTGATNIVLEDGRKITSDFAETIVFVQRDGRWKVLHAHRSSAN